MAWKRKPRFHEVDGKTYQIPPGVSFDKSKGVWTVRNKERIHVGSNRDYFKACVIWREKYNASA